MEIRSGRYSLDSQRPNRSGSSGSSSSITTATFRRPFASSGGSESSARRTCSSKVTVALTSPGRGERPALGKEVGGRHAEDEAADVGGEGDAGTGLRVRDPGTALPELEQEPEAQEHDRRDRDEEEADQ